MNLFILSGNLGRDCRVASTKGGDTVCNFAVAVKSGYGDKEQTLWIDCALWGKRAEGKLVDYLVKGAKVTVSGELGQQEGTGEHSGKTFLTCRVDKIELSGGKSDESPAPKQSQSRQQAPSSAPQNFDDFDDDIPF